MRYLELPPSIPLEDSVECLWALEGDAAASGPPERVLPDGTIEIVVHFAQPFQQLLGTGWSEQPRAFVVGPMSRALVLRASAGARVLGLRLRAAGAAALLRQPLRELADQVVPFGDLGGRAAAHERPMDELVDELLGDGWSDAEQVLARAERSLRARIAPPGEPARLAAAAAGRIFATRGALRVRELAAELGVGERRLQRAFDEAVGLSPKRLARIARLQAVLRCFASPGVSLADVAADCGYADQAHLTHEFGELAGISPAAFLTERHALSDLFSPEERLDRLLDAPAGRGTGA
jgi:AraC-like DNA-binding protein